MFDKSNSNTFLSDMTLCASATVNLDYETVFFCKLQISQIIWLF